MKSTLINNIFSPHLMDWKGRLAAEEPVRQTTEIEAVSHGAAAAPRRKLITCAVIVENGVKLRLNIVDTHGYGDQINNANCWDPIVKYIKEQHSAYLRKDLTAMRIPQSSPRGMNAPGYFILTLGTIGMKPHLLTLVPEWLRHCMSVLDVGTYLPAQRRRNDQGTLSMTPRDDCVLRDAAGLADASVRPNCITLDVTCTIVPERYSSAGASRNDLNLACADSVQAYWLDVRLTGLLIAP